jgi:hypothetical protein
MRHLIGERKSLVRDEEIEGERRGVSRPVLKASGGR